MRGSLIDEMNRPLMELRKQAFFQPSLVFQDQSYEEVVDVNRTRATLPGFDACRKYYLFRPQRERIKHRAKRTTNKAARIGAADLLALGDSLGCKIQAMNRMCCESHASDAVRKDGFRAVLVWMGRSGFLSRLQFWPPWQAAA